MYVPVRGSVQNTVRTGTRKCTEHCTYRYEEAVWHAAGEVVKHVEHLGAERQVAAHLALVLSQLLSSVFGGFLSTGNYTVHHNEHTKKDTNTRKYSNTTINTTKTYYTTAHTAANIRTEYNITEHGAHGPNNALYNICKTRT